MQTKSEDIGKCGCGRSPTGKCIGWHALSEDIYKHQLMLWMEEELRNDADEHNIKRGEQ